MTSTDKEMSLRLFVICIYIVCTCENAFSLQGRQMRLHAAKRSYGLGGGKPRPKYPTTASPSQTISISESEPPQAVTLSPAADLTTATTTTSWTPTPPATEATSSSVPLPSTQESGISKMSNKLKKYVIILAEMIKTYMNKWKIKYTTLLKTLFRKEVAEENIRKSKNLKINQIKNILENERIESTKSYVAGRLEELTNAASLASKNPKPDRYMLGTSGSYYDPADRTTYEERQQKKREESGEPTFSLVYNQDAGKWERSPEELEYLKQKRIAAGESVPPMQDYKSKEELEFSKKYKLACLAAEESLERARKEAMREAEANRRRWAEEDARK